jgi:hypothetical protein
MVTGAVQGMFEALQQIILLNINKQGDFMYKTLPPFAAKGLQCF